MECYSLPPSLIHTLICSVLTYMGHGKSASVSIKRSVNKAQTGVVLIHLVMDQDQHISVFVVPFWKQGSWGGLYRSYIKGFYKWLLLSLNNF